MVRETLDAKIARLKREVRREMRPALRAVRKFFTPRRPADRLSAALRTVAKVAVIIALPFFVYVRASVFLYRHGAAAWLAIASSMLITMGIVAAYGAWLARRVKGGGRARAATIIRWIGVPIVATWCLYAAFYLAKVNAKSDAIHSYYSSVHPILRVALSTVILLDPDLVVTEMARTPADYARMRLPVNERTRHYVQPDGWVHAVDLRTRERGEIENRSIQFYFWLMGFSTLRHVGTADHLHVQLKSR